jgi:hypothetical protein
MARLVEPVTADVQRVPFVPHPAQRAFLDAVSARTGDGRRAFHRLALISGRRGGKTAIGAVAGVREATVPNSMGWACAPSFPELHDYVLPAIRATLPTAWVEKWSDAHQEFTLVNGAKIQLRSLDDPERGRGPGLDWLWIDEGRKVMERAWLTLLPALMDKHGVAWVTTSTNGYDWVYRRFYLPARNGKPGYWAVRFGSQDNPKNTTEEIEDARSSMDDLFFRQEYLAEFVHFQGAVFGSLISPQIVPAGREQDVIPEWPNIAESRSMVVGIDPGTDHPFGALVLTLTDQGLVATDEYLARHKPLDEHARRLKAMVGGHSVLWAYDRSQAQARIELAQHGILAAPAENNVEAGIRRVEAWLVSHKVWFLESRVPETIKQLVSYRWADNTTRHGEQRSERVWKVDDELPDCFVAGTLITTARGAVPIEQMRLDDQVWTRQGWQEVEAVFKLPVHRATMALTTEDGRILRGTENHRLWVEGRGWVALRNLRYGDILWTCTQITIEAAPAPSGESTTGQFPAATTSTTSTGTRATMLSRICARSLARATDPTRPAPGHRSRCDVPPAERSVRAAPSGPGSVPMPAKRNGDEIRGSISNPESVVVVGPGLPRVDSKAPDFVPASAPVPVRTPGCASLESARSAAGHSWEPTAPSGARTSVISVTIDADAPVYNLTIAAVHEYYANGILVANCLRYACMLWPELPVPAPRPFGRDPATVPASLRWAWERERRCDREEQEAGRLWAPGEDADDTTRGVGDFYSW